MALRTGARNVRLVRFKGTSAATLANRNIIQAEKVHPEHHHEIPKKTEPLVELEHDLVPPHKKNKARKNRGGHNPQHRVREEAMEGAALYVEIEKLHPSHK
jgi:hypothetical protein